MTATTTMTGSMPEKATDLDNAMVDQKNAILAILNIAMEIESPSDESATALARATDLLDFIRPMWMVLGYGYKAREVGQRIRAVAIALQDEVDWEIKEKHLRRGSDRHIQRAALIARLRTIAERTAWAQA